MALFAILILLLATACHKEDPAEETTQPPQNTPKPVTKDNLVGTYVVTKVEMAANGNRSDYTDTWFHTFAGDCAKDDVTELKPDKSFVVRDGTNTCDESTDDTGTWDLIDTTRLKWDRDTAIIEAFDGASLRVVSPVYSSALGSIIFTYTRR
jgi:hypothetical protein